MKVYNKYLFALAGLCLLACMASCAKPKPVELLLNGTFDNEQSTGALGTPTAYDEWVDWHVDFVNNSGAWGSVFGNDDPGHTTPTDTKKVVSWAKGNYTLALSQQLTVPKGTFYASVALLLGCSDYA